MEFFHTDPPAPKPLPTLEPPASPSPNAVPLKSLTFLVTREAFSDFFVIHLVDPFTGRINGQTEELDVDETLAWFKARGADMVLLDKALDHVYNFYKGAFEISNYKEPPIKNAAIRPRID
jgi:hypothetical protein